MMRELSIRHSAAMTAFGVGIDDSEQEIRR